MRRPSPIIARPSRTRTLKYRQSAARQANHPVPHGHRPKCLSKRILDFSFGVSSALDASVDCVADKVFVISRGAALTDAERMSLRGQGVL